MRPTLEWRSRRWAPFRETFLIGFTDSEAEALRRIGWRLCQHAAPAEYQPEEATAGSLLAEQMAAAAVGLRQIEVLAVDLPEVLDPALASRLTAWCRSAAGRIEDRLEILFDETRR